MDRNQSFEKFRSNTVEDGHKDVVHLRPIEDPKK